MNNVVKTYLSTFTYTNIYKHPVDYLNVFNLQTITKVLLTGNITSEKSNACYEANYKWGKA